MSVVVVRKVPLVLLVPLGTLGCLFPSIKFSTNITLLWIRYLF